MRAQKDPDNLRSPRRKTPRPAKVLGEEQQDAQVEQEAERRDVARGERPGPGLPPRPIPPLPRKVPQDQGPHK